MTLLPGNINTDMIRIINNLHNDEVLWHIHAIARLIVQVQSGKFRRKGYMLIPADPTVSATS